MRLKTNNHSFIRFLKDEKFIEWKLFSTDELNAYWKEYLQQHPDEKEDLLIAEKHLLKINLSSYKMSSGKKQEAMKRLEQSLKTYHRKLKIRRFAYAAAAGVAAFRS